MGTREGVARTTKARPAHTRWSGPRRAQRPNLRAVPVDLFVGDQPHYLQHLLPVWLALPETDRGACYTLSGRVAERAADYGIQTRLGQPDRTADGPVVVAGGNDVLGLRGRPLVLLEHGAGQAYTGVDSVSYSGGGHRERVRLFVVPNERVASRNEVRYPGAVHLIAAPWLEWLRRTTPTDPPDRVAFGTHWDCNLCPESRSAWRWWGDAARGWAANNPGLAVWHPHPRWQRTYRGGWAAAFPEAQPCDKFEAAARSARLFVADNTSALFEWAALDRPVLVLDAPTYRQNVNHGLRFWEHADVGVRCADLADLPEAIAEARRDRPDVRARRAQITNAVFPVVDGSASLVAAAVRAL